MKNKVVLITGGSAGIGEAAAKLFAAGGASIAIADIDDAGEKVVAQLKKDGTQAAFFKVDVSDPQQMKQCVQDTVKEFGQIDVFLNNAGIEGEINPLMDYSDETFDKVMQVNVKGVFNGLKHVLPVMVEQGAGSVVNTSSVAGIRGFPGFAAYSASKHAVIGLTRVAAAEVASQGVRVNAVCPGPVDTRMMESIEEKVGEDQARASFEESIPSGRYATVEEIAEVMVFLSSEEASAVNGVAYPIDGGQTAI